MEPIFLRLIREALEDLAGYPEDYVALQQTRLKLQEALMWYEQLQRDVAESMPAPGPLFPEMAAVRNSPLGGPFTNGDDESEKDRRGQWHSL
jgi:hypothetical protein